MANSPQARKRVRQNVKRRAQNAPLQSKMRTYVKKTRKALEEKNLESSSLAYRSAQSTLDRMVSKGLIHKNKAARLKHRLHAGLKKVHQISESA